MPLTISSNDLQKVPVTMNPQTASGGTGSYTNQTWTVQSGDATLDIAADGNSAFCISGTAGVTSTIQVSIINDIGNTISDTITYSVVANTTVVSLNLSAGAPVAK